MITILKESRNNLVHANVGPVIRKRPECGGGDNISKRVRITHSC